MTCWCVNILSAFKGISARLQALRFDESVVSHEKERTNTFSVVSDDKKSGANELCFHMPNVYLYLISNCLIY